MALHRKQLSEGELRQKYYKLAKSSGVDAAITEIHREIGNLELKVFDGGYEKDRLEYVEHMRLIARDLFTLRQNEESQEFYPK